MTQNELNLLKKQLASATYYLEFGSGNSTLLATEYANIRKAMIMESDYDFMTRLIFSNPLLRKAVDEDRFLFFHADIGPTKQWGYPADDSRKAFWPEYASYPFRKGKQYDLVLVDGRFRIACILQACLYLPPGTKIIVHDFYDRPYYHIVLLFLDELERADTMGLFAVKLGNDRAMIQKILALYQYYPM